MKVSSTHDSHTPTRHDHPAALRECGGGALDDALKFFELGRLSLGQAAEVAGYSKRAFIDVLGQYGIPVADYPASELATELAW